MLRARRIYQAVAVGALLLLLVSTMEAAEPKPSLASKQTVYVPVYSHMYHGNIDRSGKANELLLSAMLSIRNVDSNGRLRVRSVDYHDSEGRRIREYLPESRTLPPLAAIEFFLEHRDMAGGAGASFLVTWDSENPVNPPIIEAVHAHIFGSQSVAFVSPGRVTRTEVNP
jgi:hypothetical protein